MVAGQAVLVAPLSGAEWGLYLPALGFVGLMIMGMAQQFVPLYSGREMWSGRGALVQIAASVAGVSLIVLSPWVSPVLESMGLGLWLLGTLLFLVWILKTVRSPKVAAGPQGKHPGFHTMDRLGIPMTSAAVVYLIAASTGFLLASPPGAPLVPIAADRWFSFFHLYTLGFILLMVFGVGFHLFPRFADAVPDLRVAKVIVAMALPGPALVALTMPFLDDPSVEVVFAVFAVFEAVAAILFALTILSLWLRSEHRRPASMFTATSGLWLILGVAFASLFGIAPNTTLEWVPVHGWINLFGFAGFEIFGVTHEVLPPFTSMGLKVSRRVTRVDFVLANAGLALVVLSFAAAFAGNALTGDILGIGGLVVLLAMVLLYGWGTAYALFGIVHPRPTK
ncbi:MAG TPA: hypothetical protein VEY12_07410 [Thermoplasmata archaeon]|nr:hypothetical protein [Thermoplasmata archaeon]